MVKHAQTIYWLFPTNCLSVFDHFAALALKELIWDHFEQILLTFWQIENRKPDLRSISTIITVEKQRKNNN